MPARQLLAPTSDFSHRGLAIMVRALWGARGRADVERREEDGVARVWWGALGVDSDINEGPRKLQETRAKDTSASASRLAIVPRHLSSGNLPERLRQSDARVWRLSLSLSLSGRCRICITPHIRDPAL